MTYCYALADGPMLSTLQSMTTQVVPDMWYAHEWYKHSAPTLYIVILFCEDTLCYYDLGIHCDNGNTHITVTVPEAIIG